MRPPYTNAPTPAAPEGVDQGRCAHAEGERPGAGTHPLPQHTFGTGMLRHPQPTSPSTNPPVPGAYVPYCTAARPARGSSEQPHYNTSTCNEFSNASRQTLRSTTHYASANTPTTTGAPALTVRPPPVRPRFYHGHPVASRSGLVPVKCLTRNATQPSFAAAAVPGTNHRRRSTPGPSVSTHALCPPWPPQTALHCTPAKTHCEGSSLILRRRQAAARIAARGTPPQAHRLPHPSTGNVRRSVLPCH